MMISIHPTHQPLIKTRNTTDVSSVKSKQKLSHPGYQTYQNSLCQFSPIFVPGDSTSWSISWWRWRRSHGPSLSHSSCTIYRGSPTVRRVWMFTCWQQIIIGDNVLTQSRER